MLRKFYILTAIFTSGLVCSAQRFDWSTSAGYPGINNSYSGAEDLAVDADGNVYVFDSANLAQESQGVAVELSTAGTNLFVYKYDPDGNLIWGRSIGSANGIITPMNLELASDGKLYLLANVNGSGIVSGTETFSLTGQVNAIMRMSLDGVLEAVFSTGLNCSTCVAFQSANDKLYYQSGNSTLRAVNYNFETISEFTFSWQSATALAIMPFTNTKVFSNGDILFAAVQRGNATIVEGEVLALEGNSALYSNLTYARFSESLEPIWAKTFPYSHMPAEGVIPVSIDANDQIYTALEILNVTTIGDLTINGDFNIWACALLSLDESGNILWVDELEASTSSRILEIYSDLSTEKTWLSIYAPSSIELDGEVVSTIATGCPMIVDIDNQGEFGTYVVLAELPGGSTGLSIGKGLDGQFFLGGMLNNGADYTINCIDYLGDKGLFVASFLDIPATPPTPIITAAGNVTLTASPEFDGVIQWFLNGELVDGANGQTYEATESGAYSVTYSYDFGCVGEASSVVENVIVVGSDEKNFSRIEIYPNPTSENVWINGIQNANTIVEFFDARGVLVYQNRNMSSGMSVSVSDFAKGVYTIRITTNEGFYSSRLIVE
jgi:hypothetical protein